MRWIRSLTTNKNKDNITDNQEDISLQSTTLPKQNDLIGYTLSSHKRKCG